MPRLRIPCFRCRTPLLFDDHDLGFTCPQCDLTYVVDHGDGVLTLVTSGELDPVVVEPAPVVVEPIEPAVAAQPVNAVVVKPPSRWPLVALTVTIGMIIGLCGGIVGGLGLGAVLFSSIFRPG
jgi:hypothetical protein